MIYAIVIVGSWFLTIITFMLGYNQGKAAGYVLGRSGEKLEDD